MRGRSKHYDDLRAFCEQTPIVDCHDHTGQCGPKYEDPIAVVRGGYFHSDLWSALSDAENARLAAGRLLDLHRDVRFDLFHANWPFDDELMFLVKNYANEFFRLGLS
jgi:hypothetical protein